MGHCKSYTLQIDRDPRLDPLVKALQDAGRTDKDRDAGYQQIDYTRPMQWGRTDGAGDCFIDDREYLELALKDWRKYKTPLESYYGGRLAIDYDTVKYGGRIPTKGYSKKELFLDRARMARREIEKGLAAQALDPKSDEYRQRLGEGLFFWMEFPYKSRWDVFEKGQRGEILAMMGRLDEIGLSSFKKYLIENGGNNHFYDDRLYRRGGSSYNPAAFNFGFYSSYAPAEFYAVLEDAGLEPVFMEISSIHADRFVCGEEIKVGHGVGIALSSGWYVFDPVNHKTGVKSGIIYPMNLRQFLSTLAVGKSGGLAMLITQKPTDKDFERHISADGYVLNLASWANMVTALKKGASSRGDKDLSERVAAFLRSHERFLHPLLSLQLYFADPENHALHPAIPKSGIADFLWLFSHKISDVSDSDTGKEAFVSHAKALLALDPNCTSAHVAMAQGGVYGFYPLSDKDIEGHFAAAVDSLPQNHKETSNLYLQWGKFMLKRGRLEEARKKFEAAWDQTSGDDEKRALAAYYLSYLDANNGDAIAAAKWMNRARDMIASDIGARNSKDTAEKWFKSLKEAQKDYPLPDPMLKKEDSLANAFADMWSIVGRALLQGVRHKPAIEALREAISFARGPNRMRTVFDLHEAYLQSGDLEVAAQLWKEGGLPSLPVK